jgi:YVTN family beta-propeller protein
MTGSSVTVIDGATDSVIATVTVGGNPRDLCFNPLNDKVYSASGAEDSTVTVIDGATNGVTTTITVGYGPLDLCHSAVQNRTYVANNGGSSISVLRDSMPEGTEETPNAEVRTRTSGATLLRRLPSDAVVFDAMGRRIAGAKPGVYFLRREPTTATKVVLTR